MTKPSMFTQPQGSRINDAMIALFTAGTIILAGVLSLAQLGVAFA